jgi:SAM-dependent methyltransferase
VIASPLDVVRSAVSLRGASVLDVGCGEGGLAKALAAEGAAVTGIDPNPEAVARARAKVPEARFEADVAEALPCGDGTFDAVVFVNALHHVPVAAMDEALREAARVLKHSGRLIVVEPLAAGSFFEALRSIEDETAARQAAQEALSRAATATSLGLLSTLSYVRREAFEDAGQFLARIVAVDPARAAAVEADRPRIIAAILGAAQWSADGKLVLDQPIKADILFRAD